MKKPSLCLKFLSKIEKNDLKIRTKRMIDNVLLTIIFIITVMRYSYFISLAVIFVMIIYNIISLSICKYYNNKLRKRIFRIFRII